MSDASSQPSGPEETPNLDPDETARFQIQTIINFLELTMCERADLSPGADEAFMWAVSEACAAARRIFTGMARGADA